MAREWAAMVGRMALVRMRRDMVVMMRVESDEGRGGNEERWRGWGEEEEEEERKRKKSGEEE
jgi:hypothetical protein